MALLAVVACATTLPGAPAKPRTGTAPAKPGARTTTGARRPYADGPTVRIALAGDPSPQISATGSWRLTDPQGSVLLRGTASETWRIERRGGPRLRAVNDRGQTSAAFDGTLVLRPDSESAFVRWNGKRYRGELHFVATDTGVLVVNRLALEDYLLGVVPLEIGPDRTTRDIAAVEAQAVAARSYTVVRLSPARAWDLIAAPTDQVYGGVDAERRVSTQAVRATTGLVLTYGGRPVSAPYSSTCGGTTAEPVEVWRARGEPFLRRVSDRRPDGEGYWCDIAPRQRWERTIASGELDGLLDRYLRQYASAPNGPLGALRAVRIDERTPSGRVASMTFTTERGSWKVRGNDIRFVLRAVGGAPLNSTSFTPEPVVGPGGRITSLTLRGSGYGHGVGMCQWGAIGRSRAGQDFRTILRTYYPGTTVAPLAE